MLSQVFASLAAKVAAGMFAAVTAAGGLAATGNLGPAQDGVANAVEAVSGIDLPDSADRADLATQDNGQVGTQGHLEDPAEGHRPDDPHDDGQGCDDDVLAVVEQGPPEDGDAFGAAVSQAAKDCEPSDNGNGGAVLGDEGNDVSDDARENNPSNGDVDGEEFGEDTADEKRRDDNAETGTTAADDRDDNATRSDDARSTDGDASSDREDNADDRADDRDGNASSADDAQSSGADTSSDGADNAERADDRRRDS